jgi:opine dehydrogenase
MSWLKESYKVNGATLQECVKNTNAYKDSKAPSNLNHIYLEEGLLTGLVPMSHLGKLAGVMTPIIDNTIQMATNLTGRNYMEEGRTLKKLGLESMDIDQVRDYVRLGVHESN